MTKRKNPHLKREPKPLVDPLKNRCSYCKADTTLGFHFDTCTRPLPGQLQLELRGVARG